MIALPCILPASATALRLSLERNNTLMQCLILAATGPRHAIVSWGAFRAQGGWVWQWKNWIDRRFMRKHGIQPA